MTIEPKAITFGLHDSLIIPIGAKSKESIEKYVGTIEQTFGNDEAFLVSFEPLVSPNNLEVWKHARCSLLTYKNQLWVDVKSKKYKAFYHAIFGNMIKESDQVIDHIMNRRLASALGYQYVRLLHVARATNSSSGRGGESLAVDFLPISTSVNPEINSVEIVYADPMDLLKMLDSKVGGFALDNVRDHHYLFYG